MKLGWIECNFLPETMTALQLKDSDGDTKVMLLVDETGHVQCMCGEYIAHLEVGVRQDIVHGGCNLTWPADRNAVLEPALKAAEFRSVTGLAATAVRGSGFFNPETPVTFVYAEGIRFPGRGWSHE